MLEGCINKDVRRYFFERYITKDAVRGYFSKGATIRAFPPLPSPRVHQQGLLGPPGLDSGLPRPPGLDSNLVVAPGQDSSLLGPPGPPRLDSGDLALDSSLLGFPGLGYGLLGLVVLDSGLLGGL